MAEYSGTFSQAFAQAHSDLGAGRTFRWNNNLYTTDRQDGRDLRAERLAREEKENEYDEMSEDTYNYNNCNDYSDYNTRNNDMYNSTMDNFRRFQQEREAEREEEERIRRENERFERIKEENARIDRENERIKRENERIRKENARRQEEAKKKNEQARKDHFEKMEEEIRNREKWQQDKQQFSPKNNSYYIMYNGNNKKLTIRNYNNQFKELLATLNNGISKENGNYYFDKENSSLQQFGKISFYGGISIHSGNSSKCKKNICNCIIVSNDDFVKIYQYIEPTLRTAKQLKDETIQFYITIKNVSNNNITKYSKLNFYYALHMKEASGLLVGMGKGDNGKASGPFQIWKDYWIDSGVGGLYPEKIDTVQGAKQAVDRYMKKYAKRQWSDSMTESECEICARIHNGGPKGASAEKKPKTEVYWNIFKTHLHKKKECRDSSRCHT